MASTLLVVGLCVLHCGALVPRANVHHSSSELRALALPRTTSQGKPLIKPEVLSPAGGWPQLKAAVAAGADAVYFGLQDGFNARARATNFAADELAHVMHFLHLRGVKGFVTINVLVFDSELAALAKLVRDVAAAGVDAVIVQDIGAVNLIRNIAPNLPIHGSTQMSITDGKGAEFVSDLGVTRIVVGRELSIKEIEAVRADTSIEIEAFVHGALCVSYSGQCFSSEAWGGRSANRGQCAQACRMPYGLMLNGSLREMGDIKYLLSPQDLMALDVVPQLIRAGVSCFKIEGRLKGPEYVALTTAAYRAAVDAEWTKFINGVDETIVSESLITAQQRQDLAQVFSRGQDENHDGLTLGFLDGPAHQTLVRGRSPRHRGLCIGEVASITSGGVQVELRGPIKRGDGVVFDCGMPEEKEEGGVVYEVIDKNGISAPKGVETTRGKATLTFQTNAIDMKRLHVGDKVWRNKDSMLETRVKETIANERRSKVTLSLSAALGEVLEIRITDENGKQGRGQTEKIVEAQNKPTDAQALQRAVGSLGDTVFFIDGGIDMSDVDFTRPMFIPVAEVKKARRAAVEELSEKRQEHQTAAGMSGTSQLSDILATALKTNAEPFVSAPLPRSVELSVLCRTLAQVQAAVQEPCVSEIIVDFLEVHGQIQACRIVKEGGKRVVAATPRVLKPDEHRLWQYYLKLDADALLIRSTGFLQQMLDLGGAGAFVPNLNATIPELRGDFSLNAANILSTDTLLDIGLARLTLTHDLNAKQICDIVTSLDEEKRERIEVIIHQHLPIFHTEHCVFCRFLSQGSSFRDCGHPCEKNTLHLLDESGKEHLVLADMGCRNTVFNAEAQSAVHWIPQLLQAGCKNLRIELVDEPPEVVAPLLRKYSSLLTRNAEPRTREVWEWLQKVPNAYGRAQGVTEGSLETRAELPREALKRTAYQ